MTMSMNDMRDYAQNQWEEDNEQNMSKHIYLPFIKKTHNI
jgi:hypothetical protein